MPCKIPLLLFLLSLLAPVGYAQPFHMNGIPNPEKTYAVIVGINNYPRGIKQLHYAAADAYAFEAWLLSKSGGSVPADNIRTYVNDSATTGNFKRKGWDWLKLKAQQGMVQRAYIYLSGHGLTVNGTSSFFLAANVKPGFTSSDIDEQGTQALSLLKEIVIQPLLAQHVQVILIMDACRDNFQDYLAPDNLGWLDPEKISAQLNIGDITFLSCSNQQASAETQYINTIDPKTKKAKRILCNHGVFTYSLLKGLMGMADSWYKPDGNISYNELDLYLKTVVPQYTGGGQTPKAVYDEHDDPLLAAIDTRVLSILQSSEDLDLTTVIGNAPAPALASCDTSCVEIPLQRNYLRLLRSIEKGVIWGDTGALYYLDWLKQNKLEPELLTDQTLNVMAMLTDSGQIIINAYLDEDKKIFHPGQKGFEDIFYKGGLLFDTLNKLSKRYFPDNPENWQYMQKYYFMTGRSMLNDPKQQNTALDYLKRAYAMDPSKMYILHAEDLVLMNLHRYDEALVNEKRVADSLPTWPYALSTIGVIYYYKGLMEQGADDSLMHHAADYIWRAINVDTGYADFWLNLGNCYTHYAALNDSALWCYQKALQLEPKFIIAWKNLALYNQTKKQFPQSIVNCESALKLDSTDATLWCMLGFAQYKIDSFGPAKSSVSIALAIDSNQKYAWLYKAQISQKLNEHEECIAALNKVITLDTANEAEYRFYLGREYSKINKYESAGDAFKKGLTLTPGYCPGYIELFTSLYNLDRFAEAVKVEFQGLHCPDATSRTRAVAWGNLACAYAHLNDTIAADSSLLHAGAEQYDTVLFNYQAACTNALLGRTEVALTALEKSLAHGYKNWSDLEADTDMDNLKNLDAYRSLLARYKH